VCVLVPASHGDFESKNEKKFRDLGQMRLQIGKDVFFREEVNRSVSGFVVCCLIRMPAKINTKPSCDVEDPRNSVMTREKERDASSKYQPATDIQKGRESNGIFRLLDGIRA
jgi:hypothetical protein